MSEKQTKSSDSLGTPFYGIIIVVVAVVFRLIYFLQLQKNSPAFHLLIHDSALFDELARNVVNNGPILDQPFYISPLYIYFLAVIYKIFGHAPDVVRMIQFGLGTGTALLTFFTTKRFFGRTIAIIAGLLTAVYAPLIFFEGNLLGTSVVTFLLVAAICCLAYAGAGWSGFLLTFLSGLFLALAVTGRPNLLLLVPIPLIYLFFQRSEFGRKTVGFAGLFLLGVAIPVIMTGAHNKAAGGQFSLLPTHGGINFYIGNHAEATGVWTAPEGIEASVSAINLEQSRKFAEQALGRELAATEVSRFWYGKAFNFIVNNPFQWIRLLVKKFLLFWSGYETPLNFDYYFHQQFSTLLKIPLFNLMVYMPLAIFGLILLAGHWRKYWLLYAVISLVCLSIVLFFMADRYRLVVMPVLIIMAAAGVIHGMRLFKERGVKRWIFAGILIALLGVEIGYTQMRITRDSFANDYYNLSLAHFINEDYKAAIQWGQKAVEANPGYENAYYNLGVSYLKLKQQEQALRAFRTVIQMDSTEAGAHRNLGGLYLMRGQYYQALDHLETSLKYEPENVTALMNLGLAYYYLQSYQEAIDAWWKLLKIDPDNEQAQNNIRAAQAQLGRMY